MLDVTRHGRERLSFADERDIDEFVDMLGRFERGEISSETWRKFRLVRGTYGQRQDDVQMLRVKIPQGVLTGPQVEALATVAEHYSRGFAHVTTRQNFQFHFLRLHDVEAAMRIVADAGITTREACGNSVRNITACPFAGVSPDELFDVTPYAEALTRYLLRHPLAAVLPRKFKIAFEGCPTDHAFASINDLGWIARVESSPGRPTRGFRLVVGGGTSILPTSAKVLFEFLPVSAMFDVAEAILRVYHRLGDHEHRQRNRMKFLIKTMGWDAWRSAVLQTLDEVRVEGGAQLPFDPDNPPEEPEPHWDRAQAPAVEDIRALAQSVDVRGPGITPSAAASASDGAAYERWRTTNVKPQRQSGYVVPIVRLLLGDITAGQLRALAGLAAAFGDGTVRLTPDQNIFLRWVPQDLLPELHERLAAAGLARAGASTIADVTSCPGAESCKLAVTQSRGLGRELAGALEANPEIARGAEDAVIKISGCPNGCGQHHIATLGFQGSVRKIDGKAVPQYFVMLGGNVTAEGATFARLAAKLPARRVRAAVERLLDLYRRERAQDETPATFFGRVPVPRIKQVLADLESLTADAATPEDYVDLAESAAFAPEVMEGECAT
jgi:sulfite reductase (NADPH) hemoprotein beta-component